MNLKLLPVLFCMLAGWAHAEVVWGPTGNHTGTSVQGVGDPLAPKGAELRLAATSLGPQGFAGAMAALDATALRGREVELTASLKVTAGSSSGAIWLRADGPDGSLAFLTTANLPVRADDGSQARAVRLYVPLATTSIKLGTTLGGIGAIEANSFRLTVSEASSGKVSAYDVLEAAMATMKANALHADQVDWAAESGRLMGSELKDAPAPEAYARISDLLKALGDRHSFLRPRAAAAGNRANAPPMQAVSSAVSNDVGHLLVPAFRGTDAAASKQFSASLCEALSSGEKAASRGWIVDLRKNPGGNMWPMIAGLRPLLGNGDIGSFKDRNGRVRPWPSQSLEACPSQLSGIPVALLIGPATASSGEAVAVAFRGRANTRFFGQPTAGVATSNRGFPLPDGSMLMLTTDAFVDRAGMPYPEGIVPDVQLGNDEDTVAAAEAWLRSQGS
ncbi:S41 family peptidase [Arenimonas alkanexedens]